MSAGGERGHFGMAIDLDRCTGCGACTVACALENNVSVAPAGVNDQTGLAWIRVRRIDSPQGYPHGESVFFPVPCQQCGRHTPCVSAWARASSSRWAERPGG